MQPSELNYNPDEVRTDTVLITSIAGAGMAFGILEGRRSRWVFCHHPTARCGAHGGTHWRAS
jgi:hypothetical protein